MTPAEVCKTKIHFPSRAKAEAARKRWEAADDTPLAVYGCVACGGYHLTSKVPGKKKRRHQKGREA